MDIFEFELKNQINFTISRRGYGKLFEKLGYPEDVLNFTKGFIEKTVNQIKSTTESKGSSVTYNESDFVSNVPFIEKYKITIDMSIESGDSDSGGGFSDADSIMYIKEGKLFLYPVIHIFAHGESRIELKNEVFSSIGHEMTHGYSEYMMLKSKFKTIKPLLDLYGEEGISVAMLFLSTNDKTETKYYRNNNIMNNPGNSFDDPFSRIAYIVSEPERRAQISELRHELDAKSRGIIDSESAVREIMNSNVYKNNYRLLNDNINEFIDLITDDEYNGIYHLIIKSFNKVFDKKYNSVGKIASYLDNLRNEYNMFFMNRSGKIVQDIIDNNMSMNGKVDHSRRTRMKDAFDKAIEIEK